MKSHLTDIITFTKNIITNFNEIGAIYPSSPFLAKELSKHIPRYKEPLKIVEVGPGTGSVTSKIVHSLKSTDHLDIIERNQEFCKILEQKYRNHINVKIHCMSILDWKPDYEYDLMICGLPFNIFEASLAESILQHFETLIKDGGIISYFEYIALPRLKKAFLDGSKKESFAATLDTTARFRKKFAVARKQVFFNLPPAYVHDLKIVKTKDQTKSYSVLKSSQQKL